MKLSLFFLLLFYSATATYVSAQENVVTGRIAGTVIDAETKQPLPGVKIFVSKTKFGAYADAEGKYAIDNVPVGRYTLHASLLSYSPQTIEDIVVVPKRTARANFELLIKHYEVDEVVVKAGSFDNISAVSVNSSTSIDNQEIRRTPGIPDVFRRLQSVSGIARSSESSAALIVRGGDPEENLTLIENVEVFSPFHFSSLSGETGGGMSIIEPRLVENVTMSTGGFGALYGDRLSAVTRITLQEPEKNRLNGDVSFDMGGLSAFFSGPVTSNSSFLVAGRRGILDLLLEMTGGEFDFKPSTWDLHTKFLYEPSIDHKISLYGMYAQDEITGSAKEEDNFDETSFSTLKKEQVAVGINWRWLFSEKGYVLLTPYYNTNDWSLRFGDEEEKKGNNGKNNIEDHIGAKAEVFYRLSAAHRLSVGGEFKRISAEYKEWAEVDTLPTGVVVPAYNIFFKPDDTYKASSFVEYYYDPLAGVTLTAGLRQDYFDYTGETTVSPRASAAVQLNETMGVSASWGVFHQFPQFYKIFLAEENKNLQSAKSVHYIAGMTYLLAPDMQLKAEGFYKNLYDIPVTSSDTGKVFKNTGSGYATGVELTLTQKMSANLYMLLNYTYSISKRQDDAQSKEYFFKFDRTHSANLMATYKLGEWWEFGLTCSYATGMPHTPFDIATRRQEDGKWFADKGPKNSARFSDYFRVDFRVDRRFIFDSWNIRTYIEVWNLTNHDNVFEYQYSNDFTTIKKEVLFPLTPMIGVAVEF